ncbi:MAG: alanine racemase [Actinomycetota bacterium]|nr:alanine racemase [Actinomycetota bacterium]
MRLPLISIDLKKIEDNTRLVAASCQRCGLGLVGVVKGCFGDPLVAKAMEAGGAKILADSQVMSLMRLTEAGFSNPFMLKQPTRDETKGAVKFSSCCFISDGAILPALAKAARQEKKECGVAIMVETGGLREGVLAAGAAELAKKIIGFQGLRLAGLATNLCQPAEGARDGGQEGPGFEPSKAGLNTLVETAKEIEDKLDLKLDFISGGSSSLWGLIEAGGAMAGINQVRIGEAILLGQETARFKPIEGAHLDAFAIFSEVLEVSDKRRGGTWVKQAVLSLGKQHIGAGMLKPQFIGRILQMGADHLVVDISEMDKLSAGDILKFIPGYYALSAACASPLVSKEYPKN